VVTPLASAVLWRFETRVLLSPLVLTKSFAVHVPAALPVVSRKMAVNVLHFDLIHCRTLRPVKLSARFPHSTCFGKLRCLGNGVGSPLPHSFKLPRGALCCSSVVEFPKHWHRCGLLVCGTLPRAPLLLACGARVAVAPCFGRFRWLRSGNISASLHSCKSTCLPRGCILLPKGPELLH
jgi:hypothetical protein